MGTAVVMAAGINGNYPGEHIAARHVSRMPPPSNDTPRVRIGCLWPVVIVALLLGLAAVLAKIAGLW